MRLCSIAGCGRKYIARGYCKNHYQRWLRTGSPLEKSKAIQCKIDGCNRKVYPAIGYCQTHWHRIQRGISVDSPIHPGVIGENNPNWNGGTSEYPNHYTLKKNRKEVLEEANYQCQICGNHTNTTHHKDFSKDNHAKENLLPACNPCHTNLHKMRRLKIKGIKVNIKNSP
jgi:hypothetical protein